MAIRFYSSLDPGAPALSDQSIFDCVKSVLKACLVTGYGGKDPAGWELTHELGSGFTVFNGSAHYTFESFGGESVNVYMHEALLNTESTVPLGVNTRSEDWFDGAPNAQKHVYGFWMAGIPNKHWSVLCDERTVHFLFSSNAGTATQPSTQFARYLYFGEYENGSGLTGPSAQVALGGGVSGGSAGGIAHPSLARGYTLLRSPTTGLNTGVPAARVLALRPRLETNAQAWNSTILISHISMTPVPLLAGGVPVGRLRGMMCEPTLSCYTLSRVVELLGGSDVWQQRITPIMLANSKTYLPMFPTTVVGGLFVSFDEEDW